MGGRARGVGGNERAVDGRTRAVDGHAAVPLGDRRPRRTRAQLAAVVLAVALALSGCGGDGVQPSPSESSTSATPTASGSATCESLTKAAGIYYAADVPEFGPRLYREFAQVATCEDPVTEALTHMVRNAPVDPDYTSLWPEGTEVLSVETSGSTATVDVSAFPALGASFEGAAVQQLVWTVTAADPAVSTVRLLVEGETPVSGHSDWSAPVGRANALDTLANVWILAPTQGANVGSPVEVTVYGTGWEGNVPIRVFEGESQVAETQVTTMMGGFAEASTSITLPPGDYTVHAYNDNGQDASLDLWDTKAFTVQ